MKLIFIVGGGIGDAISQSWGYVAAQRAGHEVYVSTMMEPARAAEELWPLIGVRPVSESRKAELDFDIVTSGSLFRHRWAELSNGWKAKRSVPPRPESEKRGNILLDGLNILTDCGIDWRFPPPPFEGIMSRPSTHPAGKRRDAGTLLRERSHAPLRERLRAPLGERKPKYLGVVCAGSPGKTETEFARWPDLLNSLPGNLPLLFLGAPREGRSSAPDAPGPGSYGLIGSARERYAAPLTAPLSVAEDAAPRERIACGTPHARSSAPLVGSARERYAAPLTAPLSVDCIGQTPTLLEVLPLLRLCKAVLSVDTGLGHLAAACGIPTVTLMPERGYDSGRSWIPGCLRALCCRHDSSLEHILWAVKEAEGL